MIPRSLRSWLPRWFAVHALWVAAVLVALYALSFIVSDAFDPDAYAWIALGTWFVFIPGSLILFAPPSLGIALAIRLITPKMRAYHWVVGTSVGAVSWIVVAVGAALITGASVAAPGLALIAVLALGAVFGMLATSIAIGGDGSTSGPV